MTNSDPNTSIILCAHGLHDVTAQCLDALREAADPAIAEVILVDDGSPTPFRADSLPDPGAPLRILRNDTAQGFLLATSRGAREAKSDFLFLLNNDTQPQPGFCTYSLQLFERFRDAGFVVSKLIYPDGRLQEAGGICFSDGRAHHIGYGYVPTDYRFNFVRTVPYGSAAALLLRRSTFEQLNGFDEAYAPAYYEDLDLQLRARQSLGLRTYYQPLSVAIHDRGSSYGETQKTHAGALVERNKKRLIEQHKDWLSRLGYGAARLVFCDACPEPDDPALSSARTLDPDMTCYLVPLSATPSPELRRALTQAGWGIAMDEDADTPLTLQGLADRLPLHESLSRLSLPPSEKGATQHLLLTPETLHMAYEQAAYDRAQLLAFVNSPGIRFLNRLVRLPGLRHIVRVCAAFVPPSNNENEKGGPAAREPRALP